MLHSWVVAFSAIAYIGLLFAVAYWGDRAGRSRQPGKGRPTTYALSLAVYCTSWTFLGSVGLAAASGLEFLTIYIGPIIMFGLFFPMLQRIVRLAKAERITSVADFLAARYGKHEGVAQVATFIALVGTLPYVALQLKAVSSSVVTLVGPEFGPGGAALPFFDHISLLVALSMALFAVLFGTRHVDATEHQEGLILAIAAESMVKLVAFIAVGLFVTLTFFDGFGDLAARIAASPMLGAAGAGFDLASWVTMTLLSFFAILLLPRQFHVTAVENNSAAEMRRARWLFPLYLVAINVFVVPIAVAGAGLLGRSVDSDTYLIALPMAAGNPVFTLAAYIGSLSAATAMVIVECVALSIMISNNLVIPTLVRRGREPEGDAGHRLLIIRRVAIVAIMLLAYAYYRLNAGNAALASIGLLAFAALAQLAPAFFGGLVWRQANARGAIAGLTAGIFMWFYTLLAPAFVKSGFIPASFVAEGPFGLAFLRPEALFGVDLPPLAHGVFWSLLLNAAAFVAFSLSRPTEAIERLQANVFVPEDLAQVPVGRRLWRTEVTNADLLRTAGRYVGTDRATDAFRRFAEERSLTIFPQAPADLHLLRYTEHLLTSAIGASSSRIVLALLLKRGDPSAKSAFKLLDDASAAIQQNRYFLQTALDQVAQGIAVFDRDLKLASWNRQFRVQLDLPEELAQMGTPLDAIVRQHAPDGAELDRIGRLARFQTWRESVGERVLEVASSAMPDGGLVVTYSDITERARTEETLEKRVRERTEELTRVNAELVRAKAEADEANSSKTRFLAGAGHDILQPLNAARLYSTALVEQAGAAPVKALVGNIDQALEAVEDIIGALLDISRLDAGAMKPELSVFRLDEILAGLMVEFGPQARDKGLRLKVVPTALVVRSDRRLLRRLLQNLVSNAVKYTRSGKVLVGCRRRGENVEIAVLDTGVGIPAERQHLIFEEFQRLDNGMAERGLGLGLSIVERISRVLGHPLALASEPGRGTRFAVTLPRVASAALPGPAPPAPSATVADIAATLVLCIDNDPQILDGLVALLGGWGCGVIAARSAEEAEAALAAAPRPPDAAVVDYHLDDGNGVAALERLRGRLDPGMMAVLITADRSTEVRRAAEDASMRLMHKPVRPAALRALIASRRAQDRVAAE
jgi:Na+/proline symporter/CheY-like chemotaxis protein